MDLRAATIAGVNAYDGGILSDPLVEDDLRSNQATPPATKLAQALEMMEMGIRLKRAALVHTEKHATQEQLDEMMNRWLCADG